MRMNAIGLSKIEIEQIIDCTSRESAVHDRRQNQSVHTTADEPASKLDQNRTAKHHMKRQEKESVSLKKVFNK